MITLLSFGVIYLYLFIAVLLPYWRFDQAQYWDHAGQLFAAWFNKLYLFPAYTGWNPFFFAGYPQNIFYGPAYEYLTVLLSFPFGLLAAQKILNIIIVVVLPISIYYCIRKFGFNKKESSLMLLLAMIPITTLSLACGGTLYSLFYVGLSSHALALPFFFFYLGKAKEQFSQLGSGQIKQVSGTNFVTMTLLVTAMILSHFIVTFAAIIAAIILISSSFNKSVFTYAVKHFIASFLCTGFFLVPLITYAGFIRDPATIFSMGFFISLPVFFLILFGGAAATLDKDKRFDRSYYLLITAFAIIIFLDFGQFNLSMDAYRFIMFFMILAMFLPAKMIFNRVQNKTTKLLLASLFIILIAIHLVMIPKGGLRIQINRNQLLIYQNQSVPYLEKIDLEPLDGRIVIIENSHRRTPRSLRHLLVRQTKNQVLKGMYAESSPHALASAKIISKLKSYLGSKNYSSPQYRAAQFNLGKLLNLFQINYILSEPPLKRKFPLVRKIKIRQDLPAYNLYKTGNYNLVELLHYHPLTQFDQWENEVKKWLDLTDSKILVKAKQLPDKVAHKNDQIEIKQHDIHPAYLRLKVSAKTDVPILIKMSYFPRWHAYVNGQETKIYQVAPSMMLVYGQGLVELKYHFNIVDYWGFILSFLGFIWLAIELLKKDTKTLDNSN